MRKRMVLALGILACMGLAAFAGYWILVPSEPISAANCERILPGMTKFQIDEMLGSPGQRIMFAEEQHVKDFWKAWAYSEVAIPPGARLVEWDAEKTRISVIFDAEGRAIEACFKEYRRETTPEKLRRWLHLGSNKNEPRNGASVALH